MDWLWKLLFYIFIGPILCMAWVGKRICEAGEPKQEQEPDEEWYKQIDKRYFGEDE